MAPITYNDLCCPELARDIWTALEQTGGCHAGSLGAIPGPEEIFAAAMEGVIRGIEAEHRFRLLKRFLAYGSLIPSRDTKSTNSADPLDDEELATCVDFTAGHMVSKFQGALAELLASAPLLALIQTLQNSGRLPSNTTLVFGNAIRCTGRTGKSRAGPSGRVGVQGPDALVFRPRSESELEICLLAEIKSMYVSPRDLREQWERHLAAVCRGVYLDGRWFPQVQVQADVPSGPLRVFVRPAAWKLTRNYRVEPDANGVGQIFMEEQTLPADSEKTAQAGPDEWRIRLAWSHDALRAAGFCLAHRYMRTVGTALAQDSEGAIRMDMSAEDAGENDFLAQLHVAIARQDDAEPDPIRREKTIELYNVLGFGWALGHGYRDDRGEPSMLYFDDLTKGSKTE